MPGTILIVDDEPDLLAGLKRSLQPDMDCRVLLACSGAEALKLMETEVVDIVLTDIRMPEMDGMTLLREIKERDSQIIVIVMTAYGTIEKAVEAIKSGAYDFIEKPFDEDRLIHLLKKGLEVNRLVRENARLLKELRKKAPFTTIVGRSQPMQRVLNTIRMLAGTDVTVIVRGETGTGKELAARTIHQTSDRRHKPMVTVNCPALPETLLESELFGYRKGAFTDASSDKKGLFDQAHGSTLFLDEIGDLSPPMQTKLLRVLEDKQIMPLGSKTSHVVDVRIIAATNQDLEAKMKAGQFREDLYYRLHVVTLAMPPVREIKEDIPLLVDHFLDKVAAEQDQAPKKITPEVLEYLLAKDWVGNVRELENTIRGWNATTSGPLITRRNEPLNPGEDGPGAVEMDFSHSYKDLKAQAIEDFTLNYLRRLLEHTKGNVTLSAQLSGIKRQSLQKIIKRYGVTVEQYRNHPSTG